MEKKNRQIATAYMATRTTDSRSPKSSLPSTKRTPHPMLDLRSDSLERTRNSGCGIPSHPLSALYKPLVPSFK